MAELRLVGAVGIKVRPQAKDFRSELRKELDNLPEATVNVNVDVDTAPADKKLDKLEKEHDGKTLNLKVGVTYDSIQRATQKLRQQLAKLRDETITIPVELSEEGINNALGKLKDAAERAEVRVDFTDDEEGYQSILKKIDRIRQEKTIREIVFDADETSLEAMENTVREKLTELDLNRTLTVDVSPNNLETLKAERKKLEAILEERRPKTLLEITADDASIEEATRKLDAMIQHIEGQSPVPVTVQAQAETLKAAADMAYVSRPRTATIFAKVNAKSLVLAEGALKSLTGLNVLKESGDLLETLVKKFDTISLKTGAIGAGIGSLADILIASTVGLFPVAEGLTQIIGLTALGPGVFSALASAVAVNIAAFDGFKEAIDGSDEALAKLPANAQKTVLAMRGTWADIVESVQDEYWSFDGMGVALAEAFTDLRPVLNEGFGLIAEDAGFFGAVTARAFQEAANSGQMLKVFDNVGTMFRNMAAGVLPFGEAIGILGLRGSETFPRFGEWVNQLARQFRDWIVEADSLGRINQWIEQGVDSLRQMFSAGNGIAKMLQGITRAANEAGAADLGDVADELNRIGDVMKGDKFQAQLADIFKGAMDGASEFNIGLQDLNTVIGESSEFVGELLKQLGSLGGGVLTDFASLVGNLKFQDGLLDSLYGMKELLEEINPGVDDLGIFLGNLGSLSGAAFRELGPLLSSVIGYLGDFSQIITDDLIAVIPTLITLVQGFVDVAGPALLTAAEAAESLLGFIDSLPAGIGGAILALGPLALIAKNLGAPFQKPVDRGVSGFFGSIRAGAAGVDEDAKRVETSSGRMSTAFGGLKGAGAGLFGLLGGPWGLALGAAVGLMSLYGQSQAKARENVDAHTRAIEEQNGVLGKGNVDELANVIAGNEKYVEALDAIGVSTRQAAKATVEGGPAYEALQAALGGAQDALYGFTEGVDPFEDGAKAGEDSVRKFADAVGTTPEKLMAAMGAFGPLSSELEKQNGIMADGISKWELINGAASESATFQSELGAALGVVADAASDTNARVDAYRQTLDILNGVSYTAQEVERNRAGSLRDLAGFLGEVDDAGNKLNTGLIDLSTGYAINTESGDKLQGMLDNLQQQQVTAATAAYDAAGGMDNQAAAAAAAAAATQPYRDTLQNLAAQGLLSQEQVDALSKSLFGVPGSTPFDITDAGSANGARARVEELTRKILATPNKTVTISEPQSPAVIQKLKDLGYVVTHLPNGMIQVSQNGAEAAGQTIDNEARRFRNANIATSADTSGAEGTLSAFVNRPRTAYIRGVMAMTEANGGIVSGKGVQEFANGGITQMHRYASGGFENHTAQIAYSSSQYPVRVWAEAETGGEAYIPLSVNKRSRSLQIWTETGKRLGAFADGAILGGSSQVPISVTINGVAMNHAQQTADTLVFALREAQRGGKYAGVGA